MLEKMKEIIAEQLSVEEDAITLESSFKEDLGADSLDLFELVMALEEEYSVEIPSDDLVKLTTVGEVINYLKDKGKNILRLLFIGFNIATIICTGSKFAIILIIGYFIINFILVLLHGKFNKPLLNLGLILFISFIFALNIEHIIPFISKLTSKFSLTIFNNRLLVYKDALNLFAINPIFGRSAYAYVVFDAVISHNFILESLVQTGIIGTLIYLTSIFLVLYKLLKNKNCDFKKYFCVFIVGYLIQGLEEPNLFEILSDCYFWLICGITMSFLRKKSFKEV